MSDLNKVANARGLQVVERGSGHFQITGGPLLVNYYPQSKKRSAYVAGTMCKRNNVTPEQAVEMAFLPPPIVEHGPKAKRKGNYRSVKFRMFGGKKTKKCHWCPTILTMDTATLDHVIPIYRGGLDNANNRVLACEPCNIRRGHAMPELGAAQ